MMSNSDWLSKNLILFMGKGGVGKTTVAEAAARHLASQGKRVLLCHVLQISDEEQKLERIAPNLWSITLRASDCFREYIIMKLKVKALYTAFLGNKLTQYLEKAAPGIREIVMLGKLWHERNNYDHVVVDMPSTGYALTMIHTPFNFAALFPGGPVYRDAQDMIATFADPRRTALVAVSLAEEMPIQESIEMAENLKKLMPTNPAELVLNRLVRVPAETQELYKTRWQKLSDDEKRNPLWTALDFRMGRLEKQQQMIAGLKEGWAAFSGRWIEIEEVPAPSEAERALGVASMLRQPSSREARRVV